MATRIPDSVDRLSPAELVRLSEQLRSELDSVAGQIPNVRRLSAVRAETIRKGIFRLVGYGIPALLGVFIAAAVVDLGVLLALFGLFMMVWEALDFVKEMSEHRKLEDEITDLQNQSDWINRDLALISRELGRREGADVPG
jgi:hypothetical protein